MWTRTASAALALITAAAGSPAASQAAQSSLAREEAVRALGALGERALPELQAALFDADRRVRRAAVAALADVGGTAGLQVLRLAMTDTDVRLRQDVVYAADRIGGLPALEILEVALWDPSEAVREAAMSVLEDSRERAASQRSN